MRTVLDLAISRDLRSDSSLSDADYDILSTLSESDGDAWRAGDLATRLMWSSSRLAHQVGRMERRGLVRRTAADDDARGAVVALTEAGREVLEAAAPAHVASVRRHLIDLLDEQDVLALDRIATAVLRALQPQDLATNVDSRSADRESPE
ncbi:MAG TPA: MarR family winged helix-turn-helix transcriptional regulator [Marmoricola sp.]